MARSASSLATSVTWASTGTKTISFTCSAGDVLAVVVCATSPTETFINPTSGWTPGPDVAASAGDFRAVTYWKKADGSETAFSIDASTASGNMSGIKVTGWTGTATLEASNENEANITGSAVTSISTNAASNTTANGAAIALFADDRWDTVETTRAYTNSFAEVVAATASGSRGGAWIAFKDLSSAAAQSTTFSCVDTGDQIYAAILVFGDVTGGSIESGAGSSAGSATASAVGASTAAAAGTAAGAAAAAGAGASIAASAGTSAGAGAASATGASTAAATGTSSGTSTATGVAPGGSTESGAGSSAGSSSASGTGASTAAAAGSSAGSSSATAVGSDGAAAIPVEARSALTTRRIVCTLATRTMTMTISQRSMIATLEAA